MSDTNRTSRNAATTPAAPAPSASCGLDDLQDDELPQAGPGFHVDDVPLPAAPFGITERPRRQAAIAVLRLIRGDTPEDIVHRPSVEALRLFDEDELEHDEALAHVDILAAVLAA